MALSKVVTYNPTEVVEINWITENFPLIGNTIQSPVIQPIPNCDEKWRIMLEFRKDPKFPYARPTIMEVILLKDQSCMDKFTVKLALDFKFRNRSLFIFESDLLVSTRNERSYLIGSYTNQNIYGLYDHNVLDVIAKLSVSGYRVSYSPSPRPMIEENFQHRVLCDFQDLSSDLEALYGDTTTTDVTFFVEGQNLCAHSAIIRCRSIVLARMLDQDMLERRTRCVCITDASFQDFDCFLRYLYTAKVKNQSWDTMFNLYSLADKYAVSALKKICSSWLDMNLKVENVSKCVVLADLHEDEELKQASKRFIQNNLRID